MPDNENGSWDSYQKLILSELKGLNAGQNKLSNEVAELRSSVEALNETKEFTDKLKEVATVDQYKKLYEDVTLLTKFKNNALAVYLTVQVFLGTIMWYMTYSK